MIYIVDSADPERIEEATEELHKVLSESELTYVPVMVFANKQDLPRALSVTELTNRMNLTEMKNRKWKVQGASMTTGDGIYEGMDWLSQEVGKKAKN